MRKIATILLLLAAAALTLQSCSSKSRKKNIWTVSLDHESKLPYGTSIAWQSLPYYFPHARVENISRNFRYTSIDNGMKYHEDSIALLVMLGLDYYISGEEWDSLKHFANAGNEIFILCNTLDRKVGSELHCDLVGGDEELPLNELNDGSENQHAMALPPDTTIRYGHKGRSLYGFFRLLADTATADTIHEAAPSEAHAVTAGDSATTLGWATRGPDFIRYRIGSGHITLHAAPLALSNYFLLQGNNRSYLDAIWHSFPAHISNIYWNEYYKHTTEGSDMSVLWRYPSTRWALILGICVLSTYVLFGIKRRQRIIPVIRPAENASVSFVETIGRLYYNKRNHANLAEKMIQHFLEWVRTYYYLDTSSLNEDFLKHLVAKSGRPEAAVRALIQAIHDVRTGSVAVTEAYLYRLHHQIQSFYNDNRN